MNSAIVFSLTTLAIVSALVAIANRPLAADAPGVGPDAGEPPAQAVHPGAPVAVTDFGAIGDGEADDTAAFRRAIDAACAPRNGRPASRRLVIPAGTYRITDTIVLTPDHNNLVIEGTGGMAGQGNTRLVWDGPEGGNLIECWSQSGLQLRDVFLDGGGKANILFRVNSSDRQNPNEYFQRFGQRAATAYTLERVRFANTHTGISLGDVSHINSDLMTFSHCGFSRLEVGIRMHSIQNLGYNIVRPDFGWVGTGIWITGGGFVTINLFNSHHTDVAIRLEGQGINTGVFRFDGVRPEQGSRTPGKRPVLLMASGSTNVFMTGAQTTANALFGDDGDLETPAFVLGPSANVVVESSHITGKVARLTGKEDGLPTLLTIRNSRFRIASDPRTGIEADDYSGYRIVDCVVSVDNHPETPYRVVERIMIPELVRHPKQAKGQPGYVEPKAADTNP